MLKKFSNLPFYLIILLLILTICFIGLIYFFLKIRPRIIPTAGLGQSALILPSASPQNKEENRLSGKGVNFNLEVVKPKIGSISAIQFKFSNEPDTELITSWEITIPPGWEFTSGDQIRQEEIIGNGSINYFLNDKSHQAIVKVFNDRDTLGHKAHWRIHFSGLQSSGIFFDGFIDGDRTDGHILIIKTVVVPGIRQPLNFELNIFANSASANTGSNSRIFQGPSSSGVYIFKALIQFPDGTSAQFQKNILIN